MTQVWLDEVAHWFAAHRRDLPWRGEPRDPWGVLVSEVMLQQTPVARVLPAYRAWLQRWPTAPDLANDSPGEAVRMWDRLGYPRRALRLHGAAVAVTHRHDGRVPERYEDLVALPGVGDYTASAVLAFAYRHRIPVLDTNVRRVIARVTAGEAAPGTATVARAERQHLGESLPAAPEDAADLSEALMEFGALVCTARSPDCGGCPVAAHCLWLELGRPASETPLPRQAPFAGSDRQVRGVLMAALRDASEPLPLESLAGLWPDGRQSRRALRSLAEDGLLVIERDVASLPGREAH